MLPVLERMTSFALVRLRILDGHMIYHIVFIIHFYMFVLSTVFFCRQQILLNSWIITDSLAEEVHAQGLDTLRADRQAIWYVFLIQDILRHFEGTQRQVVSRLRPPILRLMLGWPSALSLLLSLSDSEKPPRCLFSDQMMSSQHIVTVFHCKSV